MVGNKGFMQQLLPALVIPIVLIVFVAVMNNMFTSSTSAFQTTITNETNSSKNMASKYMTTAYDCSGSDKTTVIKRLDNESATVAATTYNLTYVPFSGCQIGLDNTLTGDINVTYLALGGVAKNTDYAAFKDIKSGTWSGYKLAGLLPYIIVAMIVLGLLVGALVFRG